MLTAKLSTIPELLATSAELFGDLPALQTPGRAPMSFAHLYTQCVEVVHALNQMGIGRNDRVAIIGGNPAETAIAILGVMSGATCATLYYAYKIDEHLAFLQRLKIKAVMITEGLETAAWEAAKQLGLQVITLTPLPDGETGLFHLSSDHADIVPIAFESEEGAFAQPDDMAQLALTSGTTAASKIVPFTQKTLYGTVDEAEGLLVPQDRYLNVLPLFHGAAIRAVLTTVAFGANTLCLAGFEVKTFFQYFQEFQPTVFLAITTMYQTLIDHAAEYADVLAQSSLRYVNAGSMGLDAETTIELERIFKVPVLQAYGATETSEITSSPRAPLPRKPGSAGVPKKAEVRILDLEDTQNFLPQGATGEIVVRGPYVMPGYEDDPEATAQAFINGWYRTGDLGYFDSDGYLFIVGRVNEIINR